MKKALAPLTAVSGNAITVASIPGIQIQIYNPFNETSYDIDQNNSIGRVKAPNYYLVGEQGISRLNNFLKKNLENNQNLGKELQVKDLKDYDGVGQKTLAVLAEAGLLDPSKVASCQKQELLDAGVHPSIVGRLMSQATAAVQKAQQLNKTASVEEFFQEVGRNNYFALELRVYITDPAMKNLVFYNVDGKKNVTKARMTTEDGKTFFKKRIQIKAANSEEYAGLFHTEMVEDTLRYAQLLPNGIIKSGDISMVSQMGEFYVSVQEIYSLETYRTKDKVLIPEMEQRRQQFCNFFREHLDWTGIKLPHMATFKPEQDFNYWSLKDGEGYVEFFSVAQRTGAMTLVNRETRKKFTVKIHWSQIETDGIARLDAGDIVRFKTVKPHESNSGRKSEFTHEAVGITYLRSSKESRKHVPSARPISRS